MASPQCNAAASERAAATAASSACASLEEHTVSSERTCAAAALFPPDSPWPWQSQETLPLMHSFLQSLARGGKPEIETAPPECTTPPRNAASVANRDWLSPRLVAGTTPLQIYPPSSPLLVAQAITRVAVGGSADEAEVYMPSPDEPESRPPNGASEALEAPSALGTKRADSKSDRSQQPDKAGIPQSQHEKSAHQSSSMRTTSRGPGHAEAQTRLSKMKQLRDESREQARRLRAVSAAKRPPIAADIVTATCTAIAATGDPVNVLARSEECLTTSARPAPDEKKARILRGNSSEREIHHRRAPLRPQNLQSIENSNTKDLIQLRYPGPSDDEDEQKKRAAAEQLRRRASERARIAKEALALAAARESREAAEKQARKWAERDRKLARFMAHRRAADALIGSGETGMSTFDPLLHHDTANMTLLQRSVPRTAQPQQGSDGAAHADAPHARDAPKTSRVGLKEPGLANGSCSLPPTAPLLVDRVLRHMHAASARNRSLNATFDPDCMLDELGSTPLGLPALPDSPHHRAQQRHAAAAARTSGAGLLAAQLLRQPPPSSVGVQNTHNFRASGTEEGAPHSPQPHTDDAVQFTLAAVAEGFKGTSFQKPEPDVSYRSAQLTDDVITVPTDSFGLYEAPGTRLPGTVTLTVHDSVAHSPASPPAAASAPASAPLAAADTPWSPDVLPSDSILLPTDLHDVDTMGYDLGYKGAASRSVLLDWDAKEMEMHSRTETLHDEPRDLWQAPHDIFRSNIAAFPKEGAGPSGYFVRAYGGGFQSGLTPPTGSSVARGLGRNSSQAAPLDISLTMLLPQDAAS